MRAWKVGQVGLCLDTGRDAFGDMSSPGTRVLVMLHPFVWGKVRPAQVDGAVSCTGGGIAKDDRITAKRLLPDIDVVWQ